jgi:O-antigen ligase
LRWHYSIENIKHLEQNAGLKKLLPSGRDQWIVYILCLAVFAGFSSFRLVISLGVIGLIVFGLLAFNIKETFKAYISRPAFYLNVLFFLVILLSFFNSEDKHHWLTFLQIKLPFLFLPLAFCSFSFFDRAFFNKILFAFACIMTISAIGVMINYAANYEYITRWVSGGGIIPTPFSHIRYTLLLVFAFFCFIWLWEEKVLVKSWLLLIPAVFIFVVIHILSSRSGWVALYVGLLFYLITYVVRYRKYLIGAVMLVTLVLAPILFYQFIPSFHNKVGYMRWNIERYQLGEVDDMSDAMRITSWRSGVKIIEEHPYTGVGVGDLLDESKKASRELFPKIKNDEDRKMPHNEFIWIWAATGIFGLIGYCVAFLFPFISGMRARNWLFAILFIIFLSAFMTEPALEEQIGSTFYLLFLLIFLTHFTHSTAAND